MIAREPVNDVADEALAAARQVLGPAARYAFTAMSAWMAANPAAAEGIADAGGVFSVRVSGFDSRPRVALVAVVRGEEHELAHVELVPAPLGRPN